MLFQLEALALYFIHPLGFGFKSNTKRNIIPYLKAKSFALAFETQEKCLWTPWISKSCSYKIINSPVFAFRMLSTVKEHSLPILFYCIFVKFGACYSLIRRALWLLLMQGSWIHACSFPKKAVSAFRHFKWHGRYINLDGAPSRRDSFNTFSDNVNNNPLQRGNIRTVQ